MKPSQASAMNPVQRLVSEFMDLMPEPMKRVVRFGSIPNAFTSELLEQMTGEKADVVAEYLETLQQHYLLNKGQGNWYYYSSEVREVIRAFWSEPPEIGAFQMANHVAVLYYEDLASQAHPPGNFVFQREALYHRLLENEQAGLEYMADLFERACDQRQIGAAQTFSIQLNKTLPELSPLAAQYAAYYEMRLDFLLNRRRSLEGELSRLINEASDLLLRARAGILLGQLLLTRYEWQTSAEVLTTSLAVLEKLKAWRYAARAMLTLGDIYIDLVENSGGVQPEGSDELSKLSRLLTGVVFLPFLILDWLRRKIWFLPGWFYYSGNYQDWILNYLLQMGGRWYRRARRTAQKVKDDATLLNALLGEANVAVQQRREAKARRTYARLAGLPEVQSSRYRLAQVFYGQGKISLLANHPTQAKQELQTALSVFQSFADEANIGAAAFALATTHLQLRENDSAAKAYLVALQAFREIQDHLSQTQVTWELEQLLEKKQIPVSVAQPVEEALVNIPEKHYLARFPSGLLRRFRTLAYWVALPLSYLFTLFIGIATSLSLIAIEFSALQASITGRLSQSDIFFLLIVGILPIFLTFWIIELVYSLLGQLWVFLVGRDSLNTLGAQPDRIILNPEGLAVESPGLREPIELAWNEIRKLVSADYKLWQRPIYLLSRQGIASDDKSIIIDGITSGYMQLRKEIVRRIGGMADHLNADTVILTHWTTYLAVLFAILHAQLLVMAGQIEITVENENTGMLIPLFLSRLLVFFIVNLIMILPPLILWRANLYRRFFSRQLGKPRRRILNVLSFGIAIVLSILALVWLLISPVLTVGGS